MGDPRKHRKKLSTPTHPWQKERIVAEKDLLKKYGLRRKYEIWKMNTILKNFTSQAKNLIASAGTQADKERKQLIAKLSGLGLLGKDAKIEDVLGLSLSDVMERRLQTIVFRKELARSMDQSRQFIVHEHIAISDKPIKAPSYLVSLTEENDIQFVGRSALASETHPERAAEKKEKKGKKSDKEEAKADDKKADEKKEASAEAKEEKKEESQSSEKKSEEKTEEKKE